MLRFIAILALTAIFAVANPVEVNPNVEATLAELSIISAVKNSAIKNSAIPIQQIKGEQVGLQTIVYTIGSRINGDSLVASASNVQYYGSSRDVKLEVNYPTSGTGKIITFVRITVDQSTNSGIAYLTKGNIGLRYIGINVEGYSTTYFRYAVEIYGY